MRRAVLVVRELPKSLNNWGIRKVDPRALAREKRRWAQAIKVEAMVQFVRPFQRPRVTVRYFFPDRRKRDRDNYPPKLILDGLRYAGLIPDDDCETIDLRPVEFGVDPANPRTEIVLEERSEEDLEIEQHVVIPDAVIAELRRDLWCGGKAALERDMVTGEVRRVAPERIALIGEGAMEPDPETVRRWRALVAGDEDRARRGLEATMERLRRTR